MFVYGMNELAKGLALDGLTGTQCTVGDRDSEFISSATWKQCLDLDQSMRRKSPSLLYHLGHLYSSCRWMRFMEGRCCFFSSIFNPREERGQRVSK